MDLSIVRCWPSLVSLSTSSYVFSCEKQHKHQFKQCINMNWSKYLKWNFNKTKNILARLFQGTVKINENSFPLWLTPLYSHSFRTLYWFRTYTAIFRGALHQQNEKSNKRHRTNSIFDFQRKQDAEWPRQTGVRLHSACCRAAM